MAYQSALCDRCITIPFDEDLKTLWTKGYGGPYAWDIGTFGTVRLRDCPFCRLVTSICADKNSLTPQDGFAPEDDTVNVWVSLQRRGFRADIGGQGNRIHVAKELPSKHRFVARAG